MTKYGTLRNASQHSASEVLYHLPPYTLCGAGTNVHSVNTNNIGSPDLSNGDNDSTDDGPNGNDVYIMNAKHEERATSFFAQPGILAAVIGGAVVGLLCAILVVMFIVYRMRKKDEGSYALEEPKRSPTANSYTKNSNREFYA
ncbi:Cell surface proteoglycan [Homalodisca vitripennis]|nr:Cell surface proteoglycan [Homalodisca vitripennis]